MTEESFLFEEPVEPEDGWPFTAPISETLLRGLEAALLTTSDDLSKAALMGVCLLRGAKHTALYSCDGDGLTKVPLGKGGKDIRLMIPSGFCSAILKVMDQSEAKKGTLSANDEWVKAKFDNGYTVYGRLLIVDDALDYDALIKKTIKGEIKYVKVPDGMDAALTRAQVVTKFESVRTTITVDGDPARIKLLTENSVGTVRDSFNLKGHAQVQASVSAELTGRAIKLCPEMAIYDNCVAYRHPDSGLLVIMANMEK